MSSRGRWLWLAAALWAVLGAGSRGQYPDTGAHSEPGVLLLRNGETLLGHLTRAGDFYRVAVPQGEIRIKADDVEMACRDLEDAYRRQRALVSAGSAVDHLRLADWCLRQGQLSHAAAELADAQDADPSHPMIAVLQRRLRAAIEPPPPPVASDRAVETSPSSEALDRMVRGLPPDAVETFTQTIQPLLMNNCTAAGCHGPQSETGLRLWRLPAGTPPSRRLTQRNLHAVLPYVDRDDPAASRLLGAVERSHGTVRAAIFTGHQAGHYEQIARWVRQVARPPEANLPATSAGSRGSGLLWLEALRQRQGMGPTRQETPSGADASSSAPDGGGTGANPDEPDAPPPSNIPRGAKIDAFVPADPFDAEIFNRRQSAAP